LRYKEPRQAAGSAPASVPAALGYPQAAHRLIWVGEVAAADEAAAIAKAAEQLRLLPAKLIATRRR